MAPQQDFSNVNLNILGYICTLLKSLLYSKYQSDICGFFLQNFALTLINLTENIKEI